MATKVKRLYGVFFNPGLNEDNLSLEIGQLFY